MKYLISSADYSIGELLRTVIQYYAALWSNILRLIENLLFRVKKVCYFGLIASYRVFNVSIIASGQSFQICSWICEDAGNTQNALFYSYNYI